LKEGNYRLPNNMVSSEYDAEVVSSIISIFQILKLRVKAEGVETKEQLPILYALNSFAVQAYLFSKPQPLAQCAAFEKIIFPA
jgi:EAL domain-containing protein (putative c-di-GMP-specific phosphodiesterase class I)